MTHPNCWACAQGYGSGVGASGHGFTLNGAKVDTTCPVSKSEVDAIVGVLGGFRLELELEGRLKKVSPGHAAPASGFAPDERVVLDRMVKEGRVCRGGDAFMQTGYWLPDGRGET